MRQLPAIAAIFSTILAATPAFAFAPQSFTARAVEIDGVYGTITVTVSPGAGEVTVSASGSPRWLPEFVAERSGDTLRLVQKDRPRRINDDTRDQRIDVRVTVPAGTALTLSDQIGDATVGDLDGPFTLDSLNSGEVTVGRVTMARLNITGSGDVVVAGTSGDAVAAIMGSGDVRIDRVGGALDARIMGSGDIQAGPVAGGVNAAIYGSGDIAVASLDGAADAQISGSGDIDLGTGRADPLTVQINGSGDVRFAGAVGAQTVRNTGSGTVRIQNR